MVMVFEIVAASRSNGLQLVIRQRMTELPTGSSQGIVEAIVRIVHLIDLEHCFQAAFIEVGIVGYKGDGGYLIMYIIDCLQVREKHIGNLFF